jgi:hypothetical protein
LLFHLGEVRAQRELGVPVKLVGLGGVLWPRLPGHPMGIYDAFDAPPRPEWQALPPSSPG